MTRPLCQEPAACMTAAPTDFDNKIREYAPNAGPAKPSFVHEGEGDPSCSAPVAESMESSMRPHCRTPGSCRAKTDGKHCSPCNLSALHKDPAFRAKRAAAFRAKMENDPEFRAAHVAKNSARLAAWRESPECKLGQDERSLRNLEKANTPEAQARRTAAIRAKVYAGIPEHRHDEVRKLACRMPAAEAKRIVMEDERLKARREVAKIRDQQLARAAREKAQAY